MRARALRRDTSIHRVESAVEPRRHDATALHFLRGRDADGRLRELASTAAAARPVLGELATRLVDGKLYEKLGFRSLGDYAREHLGVGARTVREWARVHRRLAELPLLRAAILAGEVSFTVARRVVELATPETEAACLETVRGRTVRTVEAIVAVVKAAIEEQDAAEGAEQERVAVRVPCTRRESLLWYAATELARRVAGEELPIWGCAEAIAAETACSRGIEVDDPDPSSVTARRGRRGDREHGLRDLAFPRLSWSARCSRLPRALTRLVCDLDACTPRAIDDRLRIAVASLQAVDFEMGRILRQMVDRRLFGEIGFDSLGRYASERLDLSPRTAHRLVALARCEQRAPAVASGFRRGEVTALQAATVASAARPEETREWIARAREVTLRRLEVDLAGRERTCIAFRAPPEVAALFLAALARAGSLEALLVHAIATWMREGAQFRDYADFERDEFRCATPGCTARRNLHSHHVWFRSAGGPDVEWNRVTLCAMHHERGVHREGTLRIRGRAPDHLAFDLGVGSGRVTRFASGDVRCGHLSPLRQLSQMGAWPT